MLAPLEMVLLERFSFNTEQLSRSLDLPGLLNSGHCPLRWYTFN